MKQYRIIAVVTIIMILAVVLVGRPPQTQAAEFVVSAHTWDYPDAYGQGIESVYFVVSKPWDNAVNWSYQYYNGTESAGLEIPNNSSVSLRVKVWLNGTYTGYSFVEGRDQFTRVGIVISYLGETVFSQQNLTQDGGSSANDPMFIYYYYIFLNGDPLYLGPDFQAGLIYTVVVNYEIFIY